MQAVLEEVLAKAKSLTLEEKKTLRNQVDEWITGDDSLDMKLQKALYAEGLLSEIKPPRDASRQDDFPLLQVAGKPLSETIIEERR